MSRELTDVTDEKIDGYDNVPVDVASRYIGKSPEFVRWCLIQNRAPFGCAAKMEGGQWSYSISPGLLKAYKNGSMVVYVNPPPVK